MKKIFFKKLGKGHPVLLIHGFCETHEIWEGFAEKLSEKFEVFAIDLPGFGQSPLLPVPFSIGVVAERILSWMDLNRIYQPVVIGHSLGGYVALAMANLDSKKIAGLGLFHSTPYPDSEERKNNRNRAIEFVEKNGVDPFIDPFVLNLFFDKKHPAVSQVDKIARKTSKETFSAYTAAMRDRSSSTDFLKGFEKPVLIVAGEKDSIIPVENVMEFRLLAKRSTVHVLKETAHMAMFEMPEAAEKIVSDFILSI